MNPDEQGYYSLEAFFKLMQETTKNLQEMRKAQEYMRWQFGEPEDYINFVEELDATQSGWMSSHC
jgi:hypothetical protein